MERISAAPDVEADMVECDDVRLSNRSDRPAKTMKRRKRAPVSCTECRRRKRKCDGKLPCCDCKLRDKAYGCHYADGAVPRNQEKASPLCISTSTTGTVATDSESGKTPLIIKLGYTRTGNSTADFLDRLDVSEDKTMSELGVCRVADDLYDLWERYMPFVKKLPTRAHIDKLTEFYFRKINWQYYVLDEGAFRQQLHDWHQLDLQASTAEVFRALSADTKAFPALLFEMLATSLLLMTPDAPLALGDLNHIDRMAYETMAVEYSELGVAILSLLGKRQVSLNTVIAGFFRVAFLKYFGQVIEAWHALGEAVKDAQEIGLHRTSRDPEPLTNDITKIFENQWRIQDRRRIWMLLSGWDIHTAMVLGRPAGIDDALEPPLPIDAFIATNRSVAPVLPIGADDLPTPLTRALWACRIMKYLRQVQALEKEGSCLKDFSYVDSLDQEMRQLGERMPSFFRRRNADKRFDSLPECCWMPSARATLAQLLSFNLMTLHRPYIFTRATSRFKALEACLDMLQAQREHFEVIDENQYKTFFLFFGTFDAIVLIASIYVFFPDDHLHKVAEAMQHFQWSTERFETMSGSNSLAKAAVTTLRTFSARLKQALKGEASLAAVNSLTVPLNTLNSLTYTQTMKTEFDSSVSNFDTISRCPSPRQSPLVQRKPSELSGWGLQLDWSCIEPIYATGDIAYNDLVGSVDLQDPFYFSSDICLPQFVGNFGNNSVWSVLNNNLS